MILDRHSFKKRNAQLLTKEERIARTLRSGAEQRLARERGTTTPAKLPGDELELIIRGRYHISPCQSCLATMRKMNENGVAWCREHVDELAAELHDNARARGWTAVLAAFAESTGLVDYEALVIESCDACEVVVPTLVDVLILLNRGVDQSWQAMRGGEPVSRLQSLGISSSWTEGDNDLAHHLGSGVKVIINRAFAIDAVKTRSLAIEYPQTRFVAVCHSSQSYLMHGGGNSLQKQNEFISLAIELPNCYYATVDERNYPGLLHERCIYLPNVVSLPSMADRRRNDVPVICLASRADEIKNTPQQIIALHLLRQQGYQFRVAMVSNRETALTAMAHQWRLPIDIIPWMKHDQWMKFLAGVDVGLQCSFSESFNYVALEHLSCGVPVVGSSAIRYLPNEWRADPERPEDVADKLALMLREPIEVNHCRDIASDVASECNHIFDATIRGLLDE